MEYKTLSGLCAFGLRRDLILILSTILVLSIFQSGVQAQTYTALFLGNSYTYVNDLPYLVGKLAAANGDTLIYDSNTPGGYTFRGHSTNPTTLSKINSQPWDFVILQEQSQIPALPQALTGNDYSPPNAAVLNMQIKANNPCTETVFFMTWGRKFGDTQFCAQVPAVCTFEGMQGELRKTYLLMANQNNATVAPVGMGWQLAMQNDTLINLHSNDNSHPNINGSYLAACVFYATLWRKSPIGLNFYATIDTTTAQFLQNVAHQIVFDSLDVWRVGHQDLIANFNYQQQGGGLDIQFTDSSQNAIGYWWDFGAVFDSVANPTYTFPGPGIWPVTLTVFNDCDTVSLQDSVEIIITGGRIQFHEKYEYLFEIFPQPARNELHIRRKVESTPLKSELKKNQNNILMIFDAWGRKITEIELKERTTIDLSNWKPGVYYIQEKNFVRKFLKF